jgi:hypothetical protein
MNLKDDILKFKEDIPDRIRGMIKSELKRLGRIRVI